MWKHDNFFLGITVSLVLTFVTLALIILLVPVIYNAFNLGIPDTRYLILSVVPSIFMMRYYLKKLHYGKSGAGAVLVVFIIIILYYLLVANKMTSFPTL